ncbi:CsgG/HfaB family protein [Salinisphaera sp. SPP-AMP-43]|uniref:CsgG/HfaB family protein n=1 Tax=Salinisphaera sp. SPP-AMP-43 TaxID=3121288 RepID=UPI003C6DC399
MIRWIKSSATPVALSGLLVLAITGCATESHRVIEPETVSQASRPYTGERYTVVVSNFDNRSNYGRGLFSDGGDRLGNQAQTILETDLQQTRRFKVVDRNNMSEIAREAKLRGISQALHGAQVAITGDVTDFGRKTTGDTQLYGILGSGKKQAAYAKVNLNVVDVVTSEVIYSVQGAGEYALSDRQVIGFGSASGYDATLNGKVLNLAIRQAVEKLTTAMENGQWSPSKEGHS